MSVYQDLTNSIYGVTSSGGGGGSFITTGGNLTLTDTTASTNITTGSLIVSGGTGIAGDTFIGGNLTVTGTISPSSEFTATDKTASYTAVSGDWVIYDLSAATVSSTLTLPATPAQGDTVKVTLGVENSSSAITVDIARNGSSINGGTAAEFELVQTLWKTGDTVTFTATGASTWVTTDRTIANRFACLIHRTAGQIVTTSTWETIEYNVEIYDYNSNFDSSTNFDYTVPVSGIYSIVINTRWLNPADQDLTQARIMLNGGEGVGSEIATMYQANSGTAGLSYMLNATRTLAAGDTIEADCWHNNGGDKSLSSASNRIAITLISSSGGGGGSAFVSTGDTLTLTDTTQSTSKDTGTLIVEGGIGVEKNVYIGGTLNVTGAITGDVTGDVTGTSDDTNALNSATTVVNVSSATAPTTGQVLTATSSTAATWQAAPATSSTSALDSATTTVNVDSAAAPSSGQVLTATSSTAATWQTPSAGSGGITTLAYLSAVGTGTTKVFNNTVITASYKRLEMVVTGISSDATATIRIRLSGDNGSTLATYQSIRSSQAASSNNRGRVTIDNCDSASGNREFMSNLDETGNIISGNSNVTSGVIDYIEVSCSAGSFDGGTISLYGWN